MAVKRSQRNQILGLFTATSFLTYRTSTGFFPLVYRPTHPIVLFGSTSKFPASPPAIGLRRRPARCQCTAAPPTPNPRRGRSAGRYARSDTPAHEWAPGPTPRTNALGSKPLGCWILNRYPIDSTPSCSASVASCPPICLPHHIAGHHPARVLHTAVLHHAGPNPGMIALV